MATIAIIDYGLGNLHSAAKALERVAAGGDRVRISRDPAEVAAADRVVFPGVGAIRDCMDGLRQYGLDQALRQALDAGRPVLGICVGMQALMRFSEENDGTECLGLLPGEVRFFGTDRRDPATGQRLKIPHMGWNQVRQTRAHPLWRDIAQDSRFYFVHSYFVDLPDAALVAGETDYGQRFCSAVARGNLFAVQFHPEKSQQAGLQLLANFTRWHGDEDEATSCW